MKSTEIMAGFFVQLPIKEKQFLVSLEKYFNKNKLEKLSLTKLSDRGRETAMSLVRFNAINFDGEFITLRKD